MIQDKILILRYNRGDREALREIYVLYKDELVSLASALLHDKTSAEDAVHDLFARLIDRQDKLRITQNLRRYLLTAVANGARQRYNAKKRVPECSLENESIPEIQTNDSPETVILQSEQKQRLARVLNTLPYDQREVIVLRHLSELTFKRIASMQQVSINTVQGRYRYGLAKLRSLLNGEWL